MPIGPKTLLKLVKEKKLVENLSERELTNPEGAGFDLRAGEVHTISGEAYLGINERKTSEINTLKKYDPKKTLSFVIRPLEQYLITTIESVNLPLDTTANMTLRSTLYRSGIIFSGGNTAPGYSGKLSFTLFNSGKSNVEIELGARVVHIMFFRVEGEGSKYRGQWQGGRVAATTKEKQV